MAYNTPRHPIQISREDRQAILRDVLATVPAEGSARSGVIAGVEVTTTSGQRTAYHEACERLLRSRRRQAKRAA